jgi:hypothetical protein
LEPYAAANSGSLTSPSPLVSRRVKSGKFGDPGMLEACIPGNNWNRLLGLQEDCSGAALVVVVWLAKRNASTPGAKLLVWLPVVAGAGEEPDDDGAVVAPEDDGVVDTSEVV